MSLKKHGSRKNNSSQKNKALIPTKKDTLARQRSLPEKTTYVPKNRRVTALATSGRDKRPK